MNKRKKLWALVATLASTAALLGFFIPSAVASSTPPWEPDGQAVGNIVFYDASGNVVTSGDDLSNLFSYAAATTATPRTGTIKAFVSYAFPKAGVTPGAWYATSASLATRYPNTSAPAPVNGITFPVATTTTSGGSDLGSLLGQSTFDTTAGYNNMIQVRLGDIGGNYTSQNPHVYWDTDIMVDQAADTWTQVYPAPPASGTATTTVVTASPTSPQPTSANVSFTATVTPTADGTVQFSVDGSPVGSAITVSAGKAVYPTTGAALGLGEHSITAKFTPAVPADFSGSTSSAISYTIAAATAPTTTQTALAVTPKAPVAHGTVETLTATVTPSTAVGSINFMDGSTKVGSAAVSAGKAHITTTLSVATHSLKAVFVPTDSTKFATSTSAAVSYQVLPPAAKTTTTLAVKPGTTEPYGTAIALTATETPHEAGSVSFYDGTKVIGTGKVASGVAKFTTSALHGGTHKITAKFVPTSPLPLASSTSAAKSVKITLVKTTSTLSVSPTKPVSKGTSVTLEDKLKPTTAVGTVTFKNGTKTLGTAKVSKGVAKYVTKALPKGSDSITASFAPTNKADFGPSTSKAVKISVKAAAAVRTVAVDGKTLAASGTVAPGSVLTVTGSGFQPDETVAVFVHADAIQVASVVASATGITKAVVVLPTSLPLGKHSITMAGTVTTDAFPFVIAKTAATTTVSTSTTTKAAAAGTSSTTSSSSVAETGFDARRDLIAGLVLLTAGLLALGAARKRRNAPLA